MSECFGIMSIPPSASIVSWAPKTVSLRPYCRSRRGRNGLGSETTTFVDINKRAIS